MVGTWTSLACAEAACVAAAYMHGLLKLAGIAARRPIIAHRDWVVLTGLLFWILLLVGGLELLDRVVPMLSRSVAGAAILGMTIGKLVLRSGQGFRIQLDEAD